MFWSQRILRKDIFRSGLSYQTVNNRCIFTGSKLPSDFVIRKQGTGSGPFIDLPAFTKLKDSLFIKLPAFSTLYGKIDNISVINTNPETDIHSILNEEYCDKLSMNKLTTNELPVNLIMNSPIPASNLHILEFDNYDQGVIIPKIDANILCFSGDLSKNKKSNEMTGFGILAIFGSGPIHEITLNETDTFQVKPESIVAYSSNIKINPIEIESTVRVPKFIKNQGYKLFKEEQVNNLFDKLSLFRNDKTFYTMQGPGTIYIQGNC